MSNISINTEALNAFRNEANATISTEIRVFLSAIRTKFEIIESTIKENIEAGNTSESLQNANTDAETIKTDLAKLQENLEKFDSLINNTVKNFNNVEY